MFRQQPRITPAVTEGICPSEAGRTTYFPHDIHKLQWLSVEATPPPRPSSPLMKPCLNSLDPGFNLYLHQIAPFINISPQTCLNFCNKIKSILPKVMTHPFTIFHGNCVRSFCVILLTTNKRNLLHGGHCIYLISKDMHYLISL